MPKHRVGVLFVACLSVAISLSLSTPKALAQNFTTIDVPNAIETDCNDVNTAGAIVGTYTDTNGITHGFGYWNGKFYYFNNGVNATTAYGINDNKQVVGWYTDPQGVEHGYVWSQGKYTTLDPPTSELTNAWSINNAGVVVGTFVSTSDSAYHGFTYSNGKYTVFTAPNGAILTEMTGINNKGQKVGIFDDSSGTEHGFALTSTGFQQIDYPSATVTASDRINDGGEIVGLWGTNTSGPFSGYTLIDQTFTSIMYPGSTETRTRGVNNAGTIVGRYTDTNGLIHGYQATK